MSQPVTPFLKQAGDFRNWNVYRKAVVICDVTEMFIRRELPRDSRTVDQMRQAARSCKQNIVEGVTDGAVSVEICIKLLGVAKGSLRELLEDYRDFLRQNKLTTWEHDDRRTMTGARFQPDDSARSTMMRLSLLKDVNAVRPRPWPTLWSHKSASLTICLPKLSTGCRPTS